MTDTNEQEHDPCEMCGANAWELIEGDWKRCVCGYLEIVLDKRFCSTCGGPLGRYASRRTKDCFKCKGGGEENHCKTVFCFNQLDRYSIGGFCQECLTEMEHSPDGHLWKELASYIFQAPTKIEVALKQIQEEYPEIQKSRLSNWVIKHWRSGRMKKTARGVYQTKENDDDRQTVG